MEVVYSKLKGYDDNKSIYVQNNDNTDTCNFENREQNFQTKNNRLLHNNNTFESDEGESVYKYTEVDDTEDMSTPEDILLVNTNNLIHENKSLVKASEKYNDEDNITRKYFTTQQGETHNLSSTQEGTYKNPEFWTKQYPNILNNGDYYRKIADTHIKLQDREVEPYIQDFRLDESVEYNGTSGRDVFNTLSQDDIFIEPEMSVNYKSNYTTKNDKIVHSGVPSNNSIKYNNNNDIYNKNPKEYGQIKYYNEGWLNGFNKEFNLNQKKYNVIDPNNNNYDKHVCSENKLKESDIVCNKSNAYKNIENFSYKQVKKGDERVVEDEKQDNYLMNKDCVLYSKLKENKYDCDVEASTPHERNILLKRNENMIASFNYKENQYRRRGFLQ